MKRLLVFGASGHGKVVADAALSCGWEVLGFADDRAELQRQSVSEIAVVCTGQGECSALAESAGAEVLVAIGDNRIRKQVYNKFLEFGSRMATVVHAAAVIGRQVTVGTGTVVMAGVVINSDTVVGENCIVNTSATLDHDNALGDHVHVSPGANLGGTVRVGDGTHVGIGVAVRNEVEIGPWSVVGAGSVVVSDLPGNIVAFGCPAKPVRELDD